MIIAFCAVFTAGAVAGGAVCGVSVILSKRKNKDLKKKNGIFKENIENLKKENLNLQTEFEKSKTYSKHLEEKIKDLERKHKEEIKVLNGEGFPYGALTNIKDTVQIYARSNWTDKIQVVGNINFIGTTIKPIPFNLVVNPAEKELKIINQ